MQALNYFLLKIFNFVNFLLFFFPPQKEPISSIDSDTLRESARIELVLNNTNFILHVI